MVDLVIVQFITLITDTITPNYYFMDANVDKV